MNVTAGNFGTVILEGRTANDKYARGSVLKATAVADKNYRFAGWSDGNTSASECELGYRSPFRFDRLWRDVYESDEWFLEGLREWRGGKEWC